MIKVILSGCNGKMGQVICRMLQDDETVRVVCGIDLSPAEQNGFPVVSRPSEVTVEADILIDFSHFSALDPLLEFALKTKTPVVVATTGLSREQKDRLAAASKDIPVFFSPNMSLGVSLIIEIAQKAAQVLERGFDIEIIEKHHSQKLDAPSGTALLIADAINEALSSKKEYVYDRHSSHRKRGTQELGIHTLRGGTIVGEHSVIFAGADEIIEIKHTAASREIFASGAVSAAKFLAGKSAGLYTMRDLVGRC